MIWFTTDKRTKTIEKTLVRCTGESSNTVEEVLEVLAEWEEELQSHDLGALDMEP